MKLFKLYQNKSTLDLAVYLICTLILIYCILPWRFASHYKFLDLEEMQNVLVKQMTRNISEQQSPQCEYQDIIVNNEYYFRSQYREEVFRGSEILPGGEYYPQDCRSGFSTAIIVPYRQREKQLHAFLIYMHNFLREQRIHYRIFLVEQYDQKPFNRAKLFNIGSLVAAEYGFPCLILHDVDLLPLNLGQMYVCSQQPRHMCSALDTFRFNLPYLGLFGGVVAIRTEQFQILNGMSNMYEGWGGEDDDFYRRLRAHNFDVCRFAPSYSEYTMLRHKPEQPNKNRGALLQTSSLRFHIDGLNSLVYKEKERRIHSLFTHILVET